jgi:hypothetical protein
LNRRQSRSARHRRRTSFSTHMAAMRASWNRPSCSLALVVSSDKIRQCSGPLCNTCTWDASNQASICASAWSAVRAAPVPAPARLWHQLCDRQVPDRAVAGRLRNQARRGFPAVRFLCGHQRQRHHSGVIAALGTDRAGGRHARHGSSREGVRLLSTDCGSTRQSGIWWSSSMPVGSRSWRSAMCPKRKYIVAGSGRSRWCPGVRRAMHEYGV